MSHGIKSTSTITLPWSLGQHGLNLKTWRRIHWSTVAFFLMQPMEELEFGGRKIRRIPRNIQPTVRSVECICHDCKLDLVTIR